MNEETNELPWLPFVTFPIRRCVLLARGPRRGQGSTLYYLLTDHLGSTALTVNSSGVKVGELRYQPYGETRYSSGITPTSRRFTGQIEESTIGLYDYGARFYDPALGRFVSADSIVPQPGNPQALNRYSYCYNNPLRYVDPTGRYTEEEIITHFFGPNSGKTWEDVLALFGGEGFAWGWLEMLRQANSGDWLCMSDQLSGVANNRVGRWTVGKDGKIYIDDGNGLTSADDMATRARNYKYLGLTNEYGDLDMVWFTKQQFLHTKFDPNRVDWVNVGVDVFGIVGDAAYPFGVGGQVVWGISEACEAVVTAKGFSQWMATGDPTAMVGVYTGTSPKAVEWLVYTNVGVKFGRMAPLYGTLMSMASLVLDLSPGFYQTP